MKQSLENTENDFWKNFYNKTNKAIEESKLCTLLGHHFIIKDLHHYFRENYTFFFFLAIGKIILLHPKLTLFIMYFKLSLCTIDTSI